MGWRGGGARISDFFSTQNPNLIKKFFGGGEGGGGGMGGWGGWGSVCVCGGGVVGWRDKQAQTNMPLQLL